jgi:four helix bundle protein
MFLQLAHTRIAIFEESRPLTLCCYKITKLFPSDEKFSMISQIRRAALSVHLNVVEGCSRKSALERRRFFEVARGSVLEIDAAIGIAVELGYCSESDLQGLSQLINENFRQLSALIKNASNQK